MKNCTYSAASRQHIMNICHRRAATRLAGGSQHWLGLRKCCERTILLILLLCWGEGTDHMQAGAALQTRQNGEQPGR